ARRNRRAPIVQHRDDDRRPILSRARRRGAAEHLQCDRPNGTRAGALEHRRELSRALSLAVAARLARLRKRARPGCVEGAATMSDLLRYIQWPWALSL